MAEALYDMATFFTIPMTSGKDSMKNDFKADGEKISVPPTILYSMVAKIADVRNTITSEFKASGDLIYLLGHTYNELGGSEFYRLFSELGVNVPKVRKEQAKTLYLNIMRANEQGLIESCHDISDGGMAVALAECAFGTDFGIEVNISRFKDLSVSAILFSESHSRFVVSVKPENQEAFGVLMRKDAVLLGEVTESKQIIFSHEKEKVIELPVDNLLNAWENGFVRQQESF
jgi:phosphoribosylformylglycinamidine synthase